MAFKRLKTKVFKPI